MNVVQLLPELNTGGVETGVFDLAARLAKSGHRSIVISNGGELVKQLESQGVTHISLPVHRKSPFSVLRMIGAVEKTLRQERADIVHARSRVPALIGYYAARRCGIPFITTCHGYYSKGPISGVMGWGKYVIAISQVIAKHMMEDFKVPYQRIRLIYRGVDLERFGYREPEESAKKQFVIGIIGRISPIKGHKFFLRAASKVVKAIPRVKILIVGDAPPEREKYRHELEDLSRRLGLAKYVEFMGRRDDIPEIMSRLDLLVLATVTQEAFGRVIIEAFAGGVPVVATRVGGITEVIRDGENGLLVPPEDPQSMSDAIVKALKDRRLSKELAAQGRKDAEARFTLGGMLEDTVKVYEDAIRVKRILVIKLGAVGDSVLITPSLRAIRKKNPGAYIALLIGRQASHVLKGCPYIDEVIVYDRGGKDRGWSGFFELAGQIKGYGFEEVIDLQNNLRSHLFAFLSSAPKRFGYRKGRLWFLLNNTIGDTKLPLPPVEHQFRMLEMLGIERPSCELELWPSPDDEDGARSLLEGEWVGEGQVLVGINPSASSRWATKRWPMENFAQICDALAEDEIQVILIGGKSDRELGVKLSSIMKSKPVNLIGRTSLPELVALTKRLRCLVTSDSAPMHIAAAMNVPFVALFGPTEPLRHLPPGGNRVVIKKNLRCAPCYKQACSDVRCMREITVEEVLGAIREMIKRKASYGVQAR